MKIENRLQEPALNVFILIQSGQTSAWV